MKTEHALRYLLLRHLRRHRDAVPAARLLEVTRSLSVVRAGDDWLITWRDGGASRSTRIAAAELVFYRRGDTQPDSRAADDSVATPNNARAARFAAELFGVPLPPAVADEGLEARPWLGWLEDAGLALALLLGSQPLLAIAVIALAAAERRGRRLCAALLLPVALVAPPAPVAMLAIAYATLQWLDPDRTARAARIALAGGAALVAVLRLSALGGSLAGTLVLGIAAAGVFVAATVQRIHFRALPLAWPWLCVGLAAAGASAAGWLGLAALAGALIAGVAARDRWPVQRERRLTPNG
ncbi:MAG TPA: hypothetical protein VL049_24360 [Candidatus Dormibacteraeota bacterium]|nr:hypothetical protein [Candidatus Dormibacteraeota bacterium]